MKILDNKIAVILLSVFIICSAFFSVLAYIKVSNTTSHNLYENFEFVKTYADELLNQNLYSQAIDSYKKYLHNPELIDAKKANINYIIGNIYMDNLNDYENAIAYYVKAKLILPKGELVKNINLKTVECLERLGRSLDAKQKMSKISSLNSATEISKPKGGVNVARIDDRKISMAELNYELSLLPDYMQKMFSSRKQKIEFLKQYITTELLYQTAKRRGYDKDKQIIENTFRTKKQLMVQKMFEEEIDAKIDVSDEDVKLYYEAHKNDYMEPEKTENGKTIPARQKPFEEVKSIVQIQYLQQKRDQKFAELITKLMDTYKVKIYEDVFPEDKQEKESDGQPKDKN